MKNVKKLLAAIGTLAAVATLASCNIGGIFEDAGSSTEAAQSQQQIVTPSQNVTPSQAAPSSEASQSSEADPYPATGKVYIHYKRTDNTYTNWSLWVWTKANTTGTEYQFTGEDTYGKYAEIDASTLRSFAHDGLMYIVKLGNFTEKDGSSNDREAALEDFSRDADNNYHIYLMSGTAVTYPVPGGKGDVDITVTKTIEELATAQAWTDGDLKSNFAFDDYIDFTFSTGGQYNGKYFANKQFIKLYQSENGTLTIKAKYGKEIKSVTITYTKADKNSKGAITFGDSTDLVASGTTVEVNATEVVIHAAGDGVTNGQAGITSVTIIYQ